MAATRRRLQTGSPALILSAGLLPSGLGREVLPRQHDDRWGSSRGTRCDCSRTEHRRGKQTRGHAGTHARRSARRGAGCAALPTRSARATGPTRTERTRTTGATRTAVRVHPRRVVLVVVVVTAVVSQRHSGEEDDGDDEDDPCDDGNPCRGKEDPRGPEWRCLYSSRSRRRCSCGGSPHSGGFRCFTHETNDEGVNSSCGYALLMYQL